LVTNASLKIETGSPKRLSNLEGWDPFSRRPWSSALGVITIFIPRNRHLGGDDY
jgi:hypothetical protein